MKSLRILFSVLFVMSFATTACDDGDKKSTSDEICNDTIDNDGDGRTDCYDTDCVNDAACNTNNVNNLNNVNNVNNTNNVTNPEVCTNGVDDDGDTLVDCNDSDCATAANCQTGTCTIDNIFFDSPQTCDAGFICSINEQMAAACLPEANFAGGTFYGDCGANGECPKGSGCFNDGTNNLCMPFCTETHTACPTGGACIYGVQGSDVLMLCGATDACDPVTGTGCSEAGEGCYLAGGDGSGLCVTAGTAATGATCASLDACVPGHICADAGAGNVCIALCSNTVTCAAGTCSSIGQNGLPAGIGVCL